ncbi:MAG: DUF1493 family protein [Victivallaceae bacterium]|nr:DUF1493 family protein [Victivallaceae bacterium]
MKNLSRNEIENLVKEIFNEIFEIPLEELTPEKRIFEDLGLDSLDIVDLIINLQKRFGVSLRDNENIRKIRTLGDICDFFVDLGKNPKP